MNKNATKKRKLFRKISSGVGVGITSSGITISGIGVGITSPGIGVGIFLETVTFRGHFLAPVFRHI